MCCVPHYRLARTLLEAAGAHAGASCSRDCSVLRTYHTFQCGAKFRREAAMGYEDDSNHRTYLFVGNFVPVRTPKPVTSARRPPDNADFVRIKAYLSLGILANS